MFSTTLRDLSTLPDDIADKLKPVPNKPSENYGRVMLCHNARPNGSFFTSLLVSGVIETVRPVQVWSPGLYKWAKKAERRSSKNILTWWYYIFSEHLPTALIISGIREKKILYIFFKRLNNLTVRYLFAANIFMTSADSHRTFYLIRYDFHNKYRLGKKTRNMKKFKRKNILHKDRFSRREFWAGL